MTDLAVAVVANPLELDVVLLVPTIPTTCIMMMINCAWSVVAVEKKKVAFLRLSDSHSSTEWFKFCYPVLFVVCTSLNEFRLLRHC